MRGDAKGVQAKLAVNTSGDVYEQEAEHVASQIMRTTAAPHHTPCACGGTCPRCKAGHHATPHDAGTVDRIVQRFARASSESGDVSPAVAHGTSGGGRPLDNETRSFMELRFDRDFSQVRLHSGPAAAQSARDLNALAYTAGHHIVFDAGQLAPGTAEGKRLIAHELTHVVQQSGRHQTGHSAAPATAAPMVARQAAPGGPAAPAAPAFRRACSNGPGAEPCTLARCSPGQTATATADIARGLSYVNASVTALAAAPLSGFTTRSMDWYFGGHDAATVSTISTRLGCIATSLSTGNFGCHPGYSALAYTCAGGAGFCGHLAQDICFTNKHFGEKPRQRAVIAVHEAAHLEGMSTGTPQTNPDVYEDEMRFLDISPSQAVQNADSYALFAAAIGSQDQPSTPLKTFSVGGGYALSPHADRTWYFQATLGREYQHPRIRMFQPSLNLGLTLIGEAENKETGTPVPASALTSLLFGVRIGKPRRPGEGGGLQMSLFGGPALSLQTGKVDLGAVAGVAFGYRWRMIEATVGAGYAYDPLRSNAELQHTATLGGSLTFNW